MPTLTQDAFLTRHAFQLARTSDLVSSPSADLQALAAADLDHSGAVEGPDELLHAYQALLAFSGGASELSATGRGGEAYDALKLLLVTKATVDAPLARRALADCAELAGVFAGAVDLRRSGARMAGIGLVQDALNELAAAERARGGVPAYAVDTGAAGQNRGIFGPRSEAALAAFEASRGMPRTGVVRAQLLAELDDALAAARAPAQVPAPRPPPAGGRFAGHAFDAIRAGGTLATGASGPAVEVLQQALLDMGFALKSWTVGGQTVGGVDGGFGAQTTNGLEGFQLFARARFPDVEPTGALDRATLAALEALAPAPGTTSTTSGQPNHAPAPYWEGEAARLLRIVVVKDQHRTFLYDDQGRVEKIVANAHGADGNATEPGLKKITTRLGLGSTQDTGRALWNDANAFGTRILDLSWVGRSPARSGEELHGTFARKDMGKNVSHGCVRHYNEDIEAIFDRVATGDLVAIVDSASDPRLSMPAGRTQPHIV